MERVLKDSRFDSVYAPPATALLPRESLVQRDCGDIKGQTALEAMYTSGNIELHIEAGFHWTRALRFGGPTRKKTTSMSRYSNGLWGRDHMDSARAAAAPGERLRHSAALRHDEWGREARMSQRSYVDSPAVGAEREGLNHWAAGSQSGR